MTTAAVVQQTGLGMLAAAVETARAAHRAADAACDRAQPAHDELTEQLRALQKQRRNAPDNDATAAELRALDRRVGDVERQLEVSSAALRRLVRARDNARKAEDEAQRHLETARRRARELPRAIREIVAYLVRRRNELGDAERVAAAVRKSIEEHQAMADQLEQEFVTLTGERLEVSIS